MARTTKQNFKLRDLNGVHELSQMLAQYFPQPSEYVTGIYELLLNAIEHGNLDIGLETKTQLLRQGRWREEIARRLAMPEYAKKEVDITLIQNERECRLTIADQGKGFVWQNFIRDPALNRRPNGRGLWIAFHARFDYIAFNDTGNEVTCIVEIGEPKPADPKPSLH